MFTFVITYKFNFKLNSKINWLPYAWEQCKQISTIVTGLSDGQKHTLSLNVNVIVTGHIYF